MPLSKLPNIQLEDDPEREHQQEERRQYLIKRRLAHINSDYHGKELFSCVDCFYFDGTRCCSVNFKKYKDDQEKEGNRKRWCFGYQSTKLY